jgi:hypothetical protein
MGILFPNCERDDICSADTSTTPRLLIEFTDIVNQDELKTVPGLTVYGDRPDITIPDNEDISGAILIEPFETGRLFNRSTNSAKPPLIIGEEGIETTARFVFERRTDLRLDQDDQTESNPDIVEVSYVTEYVYVSRACGFKSIFTTLRVNVIPDEDNWILGVSFPDNNSTDNITIENENSTHVNLLH